MCWINFVETVGARSGRGRRRPIRSAPTTKSSSTPNVTAPTARDAQVTVDDVNGAKASPECAAKVKNLRIVTVGAQAGGGIGVSGLVFDAAGDLLIAISSVGWAYVITILSTGLRTNWQVGGGAVFVAAAALLLASVVGKLIGTWAAGRILKWQPGEGSLIGCFSSSFGGCFRRS